MNNIMKWNSCIAIALCLFFAGCASLTDVQNYANESAKLSGYMELTDRFHDTYQREKAFVGPGTHCDSKKAQEHNALREKVYPDLKNMHLLLEAYMTTLAALAGDETFDIAKSTDGLAETIKKHPDLGVGTDQVDAYSGLFNVITNITTTWFQQKAIREMVTSADPYVQKLLEGMQTMLDVYEIHRNKEQGCIVDFLKQESTVAMQSQETMLVGVLAKEMALTKAAEYAANKDAIEKTKKGIEAMASGHGKLKDNVNSLSSDELTETLRMLSDQIRVARKAINGLS